MTDAARIRFWGTRGSIPTPGSLTDKYGGNTTCVELSFGDTNLIFDAGSGIRELGRTLMLAEQALEIHLLFTHLHWDHIQGFPFFAPAYSDTTGLTIYGADHPGGTTEDVLSDQMQGVYFPVPFSAMRARRTFQSTSPEFVINDLVVRTIEIPHPGGCLAYRVAAGDRTFVLATDCELDLRASNADEIAADIHATRRYSDDFLAFFSEADLLVIDLQYTDDEYQRRRGWGHNSVSTVADFVRQTNPRRVAFTHHDPGSSNEHVGHIAGTLADLLTTTRVTSFAAREGMTLSMDH